MFLITDTFCFKVSVIAISISIHHHKSNPPLMNYSNFRVQFIAEGFIYGQL